MPLPFRSFDVGAWCERDFSAERDARGFRRGPQAGLILAGQHTILERADHEEPPVLGQCRDHGIRVGLSIHDVDGRCAAVEHRLGSINASSPAGRLAAIVARPSLFPRDRLVVPEHRLHRQEAQRLARTAG